MCHQVSYQEVVVCLFSSMVVLKYSNHYPHFLSFRLFYKYAFFKLLVVFSLMAIASPNYLVDLLTASVAPTLHASLPISALFLTLGFFPYKVLVLTCYH